MLIKKIQGETEKQKNLYYEYDTEAQPVGEGGMGVVFHGYKVDEKTGLKSEVAIKVLHDELPDELYARAEREASIQLRHDNLVEMYGLISVFEKNKWGKDIRRHYVISEFLHGLELSDVLTGKFKEKDDDDAFQRKLFRNYVQNREETSLYIIRNVLSGVLALHDKGYIHRDIDPSNIMVTNNGYIKLIDFGIAKNLKSLNTKDRLLTATGKFMGKAEFASPELVLGDVKNQNYTTDIYALGILFYRLLVGSLPFTGSQYEVMQKQLKNVVPAKNIDNKALANVVKKATEKKQERRYSTIAELRVAIDDAEHYKPNILKSVLVKSVAAITILAFIYVAYIFVDGSVINSDNKVQGSETTEKRYNRAMQLIDTEISDSVKLGFDEMKVLADLNYDKAKIELALTYFATANAKASIKVSTRRKLLSLKDGDREELSKTINYLESISDKSQFTPDLFYILGMSYYSYDSNNKQVAIKFFNKSLQQLQEGMAPSNGFLKEDLKFRLEQNLKALQGIR